MKLRQVRVYHAEMQAKDANMQFMAWHKPDGYSWYTRGWVVSGYMGDDSHKYFSNKKKALDFINSQI